MGFFRRSSQQGLTAYLRLPGRIVYACVDRRAVTPRLLAAGVMPVEGDGWVEALARLKGKGPVSLVLRPGDYRIRMLDAPRVPRQELKSAVRWQLHELLDFDIDDASIDVLDVPYPEHSTHARQIFAVAAKNDLLTEETVLAQRAGITLSIIDILETAQRNLVRPLETRGRALATLSFTDGGGLLTLTLDGELCLVRSFGIKPVSLEDEGFDGVLDRLTLEIQRSLDHFDRQFGGVPVERLYLLPHPQVGPLRDGLATGLALAVEIFDLPQVLDVSAIAQVTSLSPDCYLAIGAALRIEDTLP